MNADMNGIFQKFSPNILRAVWETCCLLKLLWESSLPWITTCGQRNAAQMSQRKPLPSMDEQTWSPSDHYESIRVHEVTTASEVKRTPIETSQK